MTISIFTYDKDHGVELRLDPANCATESSVAIADQIRNEVCAALFERKSEVLRQEYRDGLISRFEYMMKTADMLNELLVLYRS